MSKPSKNRPARPRTSRPAWNQARKIVAKFGGPAALARALGMNPSAPYRWDFPRPYGSDGLIPAKAIPAIQQLAPLLGVVLTPEDWAPERNVYPEPESEPEVQAS